MRAIVETVIVTAFSILGKDFYNYYIDRIENPWSIVSRLFSIFYTGFLLHFDTSCSPGSHGHIQVTRMLKTNDEPTKPRLSIFMHPSTRSNSTLNHTDESLQVFSLGLHF